MATKVHTARPSVQTGPDLFAAADRQRIRALPLPARRLARRHGLPAATALLLAEHAGFNVLGVIR